MRAIALRQPAVRRRWVPPSTLGRRERGISLIIAMVMLAVIGIASAAIMRNAVSADQVATNNRLLTQANQNAQMALRFCENQMTLRAAARTVEPFASQPTAAWTTPTDWSGSGATPAHTLTAADVSSAIQPRIAPQCMVEATAVSNVFTVTARGFSSDFRADSATGATRSGSVVWLQSTLLMTGDGGSQPHDGTHDGTTAPASAAGATTAATQPADDTPAPAPGCTADCALVIRQRVWQQLLTPPF